MSVIKKTKEFAKKHPDLMYLSAMIGFKELYVINQALLTSIKFKPNAYSKWMDCGKTVCNRGDTLGGTHRLYQGHDLASNFLPFIKKFGVSKLHHFFIELGKDSLTSNGLLLPGIQKIARLKIFSDSFLTSYGSFNAGDIIPGGIAIKHSMDFYKRSKKGFTENEIKYGFPIILAKCFYGITRKSPFIIGSSMFDIGVIIQWNLKIAKDLKQGEKELNRLYKQLEFSLANIQTEIEQDEKEFIQTDKLVEKTLGIKFHNLKILKGGRQ